MKTKELVLCALFTALICVSTIFTIPLPFTPVPITLQVMAICVTGAVLGAKAGTISVIIYILIGFMGLPVFSGMKGGLGVLVGPTGGYILGFIPEVFIIGYLVSKFISYSDSRYKIYFKLSLIMILGLIVLYTVGTVQIMFITGMNVSEALMVAVIPFIPFDLFKIALGVVVSDYIKKYVYNFSSEGLNYIKLD